MSNQKLASLALSESSTGAEIMLFSRARTHLVQVGMCEIRGHPASTTSGGRNNCKKEPVIRIGIRDSSGMNTGRP